jgi:glyoxylase-like metal-dependent hydrolase (beta-lactamase superfamily II)
MRICKYETGKLNSNTYFVINDETNEGFLVDCGGTPKDIALLIDREGLVPKGILLTHGHIDHIEGADGIAKRYGCPVFIHKYDSSFLVRPEENLSVRLGYPSFSLSVEPSLLSDGDILELADFSVEVIHTPGHTAGSVCFRCGEVIFTGDTLFYESVGNDLPPYGSLSDEIDSIRRKLFSLEEDCICYPGHGIETTLNHEKKYNMFCRV